MNTFSKYITAAASVTMVLTVLQYDKQTGLDDNWIHNRQLIESRVHLTHTGIVDGAPKFFQDSYDANLVEIGKYHIQYQCASGKDTTKCLPVKQM